MATVPLNWLRNVIIHGISDDIMAIRGEAVQLVRKILLKCELIGDNLHIHINGCNNTGVYEEIESSGHVFG